MELTDCSYFTAVIHPGGELFSSAGHFVFRLFIPIFSRLKRRKSWTRPIKNKPYLLVRLKSKLN